jgi:hypothetical protein
MTASHEPDWYWKEPVYTKHVWNEKLPNGEYRFYLMHHEVYDHGHTEEEAVAELTYYFGPYLPQHWVKDDDFSPQTWWRSAPSSQSDITTTVEDEK